MYIFYKIVVFFFDLRHFPHALGCVVRCCGIGSLGELGIVCVHHIVCEVSSDSCYCYLLRVKTLPPIILLAALFLMNVGLANTVPHLGFGQVARTSV